ncbi:MAG: hypothetical protein REI78_02910 [Pedobacter sp.]|nr:hypothetical protein [Pedobacter sp.]
MSPAQLEQFRKEFLEHYQNLLEKAEIDQNGNLVATMRPNVIFDEAANHIRESILDTVDFEEHLDIHLYSQELDEFRELGIN